MSPVLMSYLRTVGEAGAAALEVAVGSAGSTGAGGIGGSLMP